MICSFELEVLDSRVDSITNITHVLYDFMWLFTLCIDFRPVFGVWLLREEHLFSLIWNTACSMTWVLLILPLIFFLNVFLLKILQDEKAVVYFSYPSRVLLGHVGSSIKYWYLDLGFFFFGRHKLTMCHTYNKWKIWGSFCDSFV